MGAALASLVLLALAALAEVPEEPAPRPNVVLILADDLGYGDLGCYGQAKIRTPNLDRLASEGLRFTQFYAGGAVCVPSRASLLTGKHTGHAALRVNVTQPLPAEELTLAEHLRAAGYRTACIGKWALGNSVKKGSPSVQGFNTYFGYIDQIQAHRYYPPFLLRDDERVELPDNPAQRTRYSQDLITEEALRFLDATQAISDSDSPDFGRPFFLYVPYCLPHADLDVPEDSLAPYRALGWTETPYVEQGGERLYRDQPEPRATYAGMVSRLDRDVGRILDKLRELELERETLVLFSSDNGPSPEGGADPEFFDSNGPFRGGKGGLYEGALRVPLLARWPGRITPGTSAHPCAAWDLFPSLAELAGTSVPEGLDGLSLVPTLLGRAEEQRTHAYLYWEHSAPGPFHSQAVRAGDLKLLRLAVHARKPRVELYDVALDPGETRDLAAERPEAVAELVAHLEAAHVPDPKSPLLLREIDPGAARRAGKDR